VICIVHIGTEKTGTTSFQSFMARNRIHLLEQGVVYPAQLGNDNHRMLATYCLPLDQSDDSFVGYGIKGHEDMREFSSRVESRFLSQMDEARHQRICLISSEHFHSRLKDTNQIVRLKKLLNKVFDRIEIHVHLRPQVDMLVSLASTQARVGGSVKRAFFDRATPNNPYFDYDSMVLRWENVFGSDSVFCLPFKNEPDFFSHATKRMSIRIDTLGKPERINEAIDVRVMEIINALVDSGSKTRIDFRVIDRLPVIEKLRIDRATAQRIQARFEYGNRNLVSRRADLKPGDLQPKWADYPEQGNSDILEQHCSFSSTLASLLEIYNEEIKKARESKN